MAEHGNLVCQCLECLESIEFPAEGIGVEIECPHCHQNTRLYDPAEDAGTKGLLPVSTDAEPLSESNVPPPVTTPPPIPLVVENYEPPRLSTPSLAYCKTCNGLVAESSRSCIHCGQSWPT